MAFGSNRVDGTHSGFLDRCTGETAVSTKREFESPPSWCNAGDIQCRTLISEASRASDLDDDQRSNLRGICLTRLFAMLTRFDRKSATDVSRKKGKDLGGFGKKWRMQQLRKCFVFWSGRWESNPRPKLGKLLYCHCTTPARCF